MEKKTGNRQKKNNKKVQKAPVAYHHSRAESIRSDVLGSYTGVPYDGEQPEQDADDL